MLKPKVLKVTPDWPRKTPCKLAFVGEAPADIETLGKYPLKPENRGQPLIGPSGDIFNNILKICNVDRRDCLITNVFDKQIPGNDIEKWCIGRKDLPKGYNFPEISRGKFLDPKYLYHFDRLAEELEKAQPSLIVPLGGTALWAFTGQSNIKARRGVPSMASFQGRTWKILPTFHPAFFIHSYHLKPLAVWDVLRAVSEAEFLEIRTTPRELWIDPTLNEIREFRERFLDHAPYISVDIETPYMKRGLSRRYQQIKCIGFSDGPEHAICVPFVDERQPSNSYWRTLDDELEAWRLVQEIAELDVPKLGQNFGAYDLHWLWTIYGIRFRNLSLDTRLQHHAKYPELPKDLGSLGATYAREIAWKTLRIAGTGKRDE